MGSRRLTSVMTVLVIAALFAAQTASAAGYTLTVTTNATSYAEGQQIKVTGTVSPAPGSSTGVTVRIFNPTGIMVAAGEADVGASTGAYNYTFVAGGSSGWTVGTYTVNATWGAFPPTISQKTTFAYTGGATTTSTSTSSSSSTTSTTSSSSTSSSSSSTSASSSTQSTSSTSSSSSSSSGGGGGIPEFPFQAAFAGLVVAAIAVGYLLTRRSVGRRPIAPPIG